MQNGYVGILVTYKKKRLQLFFDFASLSLAKTNGKEKGIKEFSILIGPGSGRSN